MQLKMFLVGAMVLSLVVLPAWSQLDSDCIITAVQNGRLSQACTTDQLLNLGDLNTLCNSGSCTDAVLSLYCDCGFGAAAGVCGRTCSSSVTITPSLPGPSSSPVTSTGGSFGGRIPTAAQIQCFEDMVDGNDEFENFCGGLDMETSSLSELCNSGACLDAVRTIYESCGYYCIDDLCSDGGAGLSPTNEQTQCLTTQSQLNSADVLRECPIDELSSGEFSAICANQGCRAVLQRIYAACNLENSLRILCGDGTSGSCSSGNGGNGNGGDGDGGNTGVSVPPPTVTQSQCITMGVRNRASDIASSCGGSDISDISSLCVNRACVAVLRDIYSSCNYANAIDITCNFGSNSEGQGGNNLGFNNVYNAVITRSTTDGGAVPIKATFASVLIITVIAMMF